MSRILLVETSTALTSVGLSEDGIITAYRESTVPRSQASLTAPFIKEVLDERGISVKSCDAVCVSKGPGSYTGLRVGTSTVKGLCFSAGVPLISVGTLDVIACQAVETGALPEGCKTIVPMIDARRMEVYTAIFNTSGERLSDIEARIITPESFREELSEGPVLFAGDGALKCRETLNSENAFFLECFPSARYMQAPALKAFESGIFEDTAYFEPFYLKEFVATVSRKSLV